MGSRQHLTVVDNFFFFSVTSSYLLFVSFLFNFCPFPKKKRIIIQVLQSFLQKMNTNETDVLQIAIHSADRFPDESDKAGFYSNQTLYTILSDPVDSQSTQNFTPSWLPPDQITVDICISSPVEEEEASPVLWRGDHVLSKTFSNVRNCELRTTFLLKVLRAARLELGEREPWCTLTDSGIPYTLSILGVEYVFQKPPTVCRSPSRMRIDKRPQW